MPDFRKFDQPAMWSAPLAFGAMIIVVAALHDQPLGKALYRENGPIELPTFFGLAAACVLAIVAARRLWRRDKDVLQAGALCAFATGCFLVAGEEIAWGQWFMGYQTPEDWAAINVQGEMTLHNIEGLQGKSEIFRVIFGLGGLVAILLTHWRRLRTVAPPVALAPWFLLIALFGGGELMTDWVTLPIEVVQDGLRAKLLSELQELAIAGVALAYGMSMYAIAARDVRHGETGSYLYLRKAMPKPRRVD